LTTRSTGGQDNRIEPKSEAPTYRPLAAGRVAAGLDILAVEFDRYLTLPLE
jgi:hypothetical protein